VNLQWMLSRKEASAFYTGGQHTQQQQQAAQRQQQRRLTPGEIFMTGCFAGAAQMPITLASENIKTKMQVLNAHYFFLSRDCAAVHERSTHLLHSLASLV
jgi:hypothetical protein